MTEFPGGAAFGTRIPFVQLKKKGLPARFSEWIKSLVWSYKLSPATIGLAATDNVREIEVMDLTLKEKCAETRARATLIAAIDRLIPSPIIFRVFDEDGAPRLTALNIKASGGALHGDSDVFRLFSTDKDVPLPSGVVDLEAFLKRFASAVCGMRTSADESLFGFDARHYRFESLRADLEDVERKISRETQLDRKYALSKTRLRIKKEMQECQNLNT